MSRISSRFLGFFRKNSENSDSNIFNSNKFNVAKGPSDNPEDNFSHRTKSLETSTRFDIDSISRDMNRCTIINNNTIYNTRNLVRTEEIKRSPENTFKKSPRKSPRNSPKNTFKKSKNSFKKSPIKISQEQSQEQLEENNTLSISPFNLPIASSPPSKNKKHIYSII